MPDHDLSLANWGQVSNQSVDLLRIANQIVWSAPPVGDPIEEAFVFADPAESARSFDDAQPLTLGLVWETTVVGTWIGNRVFTPFPSPSSMIGVGYNADTTVELARKTILTPPIEQLLDFIFDVPATVSPGVNYIAAYYTASRYVATSSGDVPWPVTTSRLYTASSVVGRWTQGAPTPTMPTNPTETNYHVSPIVRFS